MCVGEVVLSLFFEVLLAKRLTLYYVPNFQGHIMHCVEMEALLSEVGGAENVWGELGPP